jgi:hypothetical protein
MTRLTPYAAVHADFVGRDDHRLVGQALVDRRQLAGFHQRRQIGRFLVLLGRRRERDERAQADDRNEN